MVLAQTGTLRREALVGQYRSVTTGCFGVRRCWGSKCVSIGTHACGWAWFDGGCSFGVPTAAGDTDEHRNLTVLGKH